jgi:hypothetical protein
LLPNSKNIDTGFNGFSTLSGGYNGAVNCTKKKCSGTVTVFWDCTCGRCEGEVYYNHRTQMAVLGVYAIKASPNQILIFSYIGMKISKFSILYLLLIIALRQ